MIDGNGKTDYNTGRCAEVRKGRKAMHAYYEKKKDQLKEQMDGFLRLIAKELKACTDKPYADLFPEMWKYYEKKLLERFPYIGGDDVSGTATLTGAYFYVAMGEVLKKYGVSMQEIGHLSVLSYERQYKRMPKMVKRVMAKTWNYPSLLKKNYLKQDRKNQANAAKNPRSFQTQTVIPPEEGCAFSWRTTVCPLASFAWRYGYEEYLPWLCNLDYVMYGVLGVPFFRKQTIADGADWCDFNIKYGVDPLPYWPPVFQQENEYK